MGYVSPHDNKVNTSWLPGATSLSTGILSHHIQCVLEVKLQSTVAVNFELR